MTISRNHAVSLAVLLAVAAATAHVPARAEETCASCHGTHMDDRLRRPAQSAVRDAHGRNGVTCSRCHGGDPTAISARAHDLGHGFVGRADQVGTTQICSSCHDGSREDAPAVVEAYRAGRHGRALSEGRSSAVCTSCHGAHGIEDPRGEDGERVAGTNDAEPPSQAHREVAPELAPGASPVRRRVVAQCIECHSDAQVMAESGLRTDQANLWQHSVHGRAVAEGNSRAPDCASCHDPHENTAGLAAVQACGVCHEDLRAAFDRGPHAERFQRLGFLDCAECHGSHGVAPASASMLTGIGAVCTRCHGRGQEAFEAVQAISALAPALDRARAVLPGNDPRRLAMVAAVHALDAEALRTAIEAAGDLGEAPEPEGAMIAEPLWPLFLQAGGLLVLGLAGGLLLLRSRRLS